jgi:carboxymethylenebutenolidase
MRFECSSRGCIVLLACSLAIGLGACGGSDDSGKPQQDAARDNVDAMSREHANDAGIPSSAADIAPERDVIAERLPYAEVGDQLVYGHFVFPAEMVEPLPAVIVIHEWWGLNDGVRAMADRIAAQGYIVLAVDLFAGKTAEEPSGARKLMLEVVENPGPANENILQAYQFVSDTAGAPAIASLGWCFGGGWSLNAALLLPEDLDAAVIYYGQVTADEERLQPLDVPLLGIFAENDNGIPVQSVTAFEDALERLRKDHDIRIYPDVGHAFANPSGRNYDAAAAADAWSLTMEFLERHLTVPLP